MTLSRFYILYRQQSEKSFMKIRLSEPINVKVEADQLMNLNVNDLEFSNNQEILDFIVKLDESVAEVDFSLNLIKALIKNFADIDIEKEDLKQELMPLLEDKKESIIIDGKKYILASEETEKTEEIEEG